MSTYLEGRVELCKLLKKLKALESKYESGTAKHAKAWLGSKKKKDKKTNGRLGLLWAKVLRKVGLAFNTSCLPG